MATRLDVGKVALGAFLVPWWNRRAFGRALFIPIVLLGTLSVSWYYGESYLPRWSGWPLYAVYWAAFALFAVTCHRLVLLDPSIVAVRIVPRWSLRETRFFAWMAVVGLVFGAVTFAGTMLALNVARPFITEPDSAWFRASVFAAKTVAFYFFARLCVVLPATAVDRKVDLKWAWRLTRGNGWRLVAVVAVLPWAISHAVDLLYRSDATVIETIALAFVGCALFAIEVAAISLSYRELVAGEAGA